MAKKFSAAPAQARPPEPASTPTSAPATDGGVPARGAPPVWKRRLFSNGAYVECAVFRTEVDRGQSSFAAFDVVIDRSYRDGQGEWHTTRSLRRDDLLVAAHVLQRAYAWISEQDHA